MTDKNKTPEPEKMTFEQAIEKLAENCKREVVENARLLHGPKEGEKDEVELEEQARFLVGVLGWLESQANEAGEAALMDQDR